MEETALTLVEEATDANTPAFRLAMLAEMNLDLGRILINGFALL